MAAAVIDSAPPPFPAAFPRLLEREAALAGAGAVLERARGGEGAALFVLGDAGAGKTSILEAARRSAAGFATGEGRGSVVEASLPFGILEQALAALGEGSPLDAAPTGSGATDARATRLSATLRWLEAATVRQPLLLLLDDLHWADGDSLALLTLICRRLARRPLAVVAGLRPHPPAALEAAHALAAGPGASIEQLRPLSAEASAALVGRHAGGAVDDAAQRRAGELCAGNPLLLEEAARVLGRGEALPEPAGVPPLSALVLSRLVDGDQEALRYGRCAAVLGVAFRPALSAELAGMPAAHGDAVLESLCRTGLVRGASAGRGEFVHPLFRQALLESLDAPVRARLHARAFRLLVDAGAPPTEAAEHALAGHLEGDATAVAILEAAGRAALRVGAVSSAARYLRGAVELAGDRAPAATRVALAEGELLSGAGEAAAAVCEAVLADAAAPAADRAAALAVLGRADFRHGDLAASAEHYAAALRLAEGAAPGLAVEVLLDLASVSFFAAGPAASLPLARRARALAAATAAPTRALADCAWGFAALAGGDVAGLEVAAAGSQTIEELELTARAASLAWYGSAAALAERHPAALAAFALAGRWAEFGDPVIRALILATAAEHLARTGRLASALERLDEAAVVARGIAMAELFAGSIRAGVLLDAGEIAAADRRAAAAEAASEELRDGLARMRLRLLRLRRHLRTWQAAVAAADALALEQLAGELGVAEPCLLPWAREAVTAHLAAGRVADAERVTAWLEAAGVRLPCRWPAAAARGARAALLELAGDVEGAIAAHEQGVALLEAAGLPLERSRSLTELGALLRRCGRIAPARALLAEAVRLAEEVGAAGVAARPLEELRLAGGRRRGGRLADDRLTAAELRVARLAAQGATNAEIARHLFLSAKTVDTHLQHVFAKLGINSRRALIPMAAQLGEEPAE
jgi:DNA-binding CsgD family transcriptional regulator